MVNKLPANVGDVTDVGSIPGPGGPLEEDMATTTPVFLPGESRGQRRLAGCSPWTHKELDKTELLTLLFPALAGRFLSIAQPGKSLMVSFWAGKFLTWMKSN